MRVLLLCLGLVSTATEGTARRQGAVPQPRAIRYRFVRMWVPHGSSVAPNRDPVANESSVYADFKLTLPAAGADRVVMIVAARRSSETMARMAPMAQLREALRACSRRTGDRRSTVRLRRSGLRGVLVRRPTGGVVVCSLFACDEATFLSARWARSSGAASADRTVLEVLTGLRVDRESAPRGPRERSSDPTRRRRPSAAGLNTNH